MDAVDHIEEILLGAEDRSIAAPGAVSHVVGDIAHADQLIDVRQFQDALDVLTLDAKLANAGLGLACLVRAWRLDAADDDVFAAQQTDTL